MCLLHPPVSADEDEEELPPLELLGFIADFSDDEEGWTDPETIEDLFSLDANGGGEQEQEAETARDVDPEPATVEEKAAAEDMAAEADKGGAERDVK